MVPSWGGEELLFPSIFYFSDSSDEERPNSKCCFEEEGFCRSLRAVGIITAQIEVLSYSNMISSEKSSSTFGSGPAALVNVGKASSVLSGTRTLAHRVFSKALMNG